MFYSLLLHNGPKGDSIWWKNSIRQSKALVVKETYSTKMVTQSKKRRSLKLVRGASFPDISVPMRMQICQWHCVNRNRISLKQLPKITVHCALISLVQKIIFFITTNLLPSLPTEPQIPAMVLSAYPSHPTLQWGHPMSSFFVAVDWVLPLQY